MQGEDWASKVLEKFSALPDQGLSRRGAAHHSNQACAGTATVGTAIKQPRENAKDNVHLNLTVTGGQHEMPRARQSRHRGRPCQLVAAGIRFKLGAIVSLNCAAGARWRSRRAKRIGSVGVLQAGCASWGGAPCQEGATKRVQNREVGSIVLKGRQQPWKDCMAHMSN